MKIKINHSAKEVIEKIEKEYFEGTPLLLAIQNYKPLLSKDQRQYARRKLNCDYMVDYARTNYEVIDIDGLIDLAKKNGIMVYKFEDGKKVYL